MTLDKQRVTNIVNTIEQHFWDIVKTIPIVKHLASDYDGGFWFETYYLSNTFYLFYQASAVKPSPSGLGCRGKKSDCLIYYIFYTIFILKIYKYGDFH